MNITNSRLWSFMTKLGLVVAVLMLALVPNTSRGSVVPEPSGNSEDCFIQVYGYTEECAESGPLTVTVHYDNGCSQVYTVTGNNVPDPPPDEGGDFIPGIEDCGNVSGVTLTQGNGESLTVDRDDFGRNLEFCFRLWRNIPICWCVSFNFYSGSLYIRTYFRWC